MKKNQGRKLPFFYHWKLSRKLLLLFLGVCVLPITVILGITMYRMVCSSIQMQLYTMDQNYDRVVQNFENIQERMERIASLIMVSDEVGDALRSNKQDSLVDELQRFDRLSDYTYQLEMSSDDISILYYIPDQFLISGSGNTCYRPESELTKWSVDAETMEQTAGDSWKVIQEKNRYGQRKSYLANFRVICYGIICALTFVLLQLGSRQFLGRVHRLDTTMEAVDQGILEPIDVPECRDELGRLILRYNGMVEQIQRLMEEQYILGKEKSEAQLHALQAQISPHFLYNTLDMMNWMAVKGETDNIRAVLSAMSRFYRMVLSRGAYIITIGEEIRMCQAYMEIQVLRKKNKLQFEVDVDEEIYPYLIPKITLQPILENAVLHGIDEKEGGRGTIRLSGRIQEDQIILEVQDDGVGMDPALLSEENLSEHSGKHYGLSNVRTRLWLFYEKNAELSCSSAPGLGTKITLRFPKKSDVEDTDG